MENKKEYGYEVIATVGGRVWEYGNDFSDYFRAAKFAEYLKTLRKNAVVYIIRTEW